MPENKKMTIDNMNKLLENLSDKTNRNAQFKTVIALNLNRKQHLFTGIAKGEITLEKTGNQGFGYDPSFQSGRFNPYFCRTFNGRKSGNEPSGKSNKIAYKFFKFIVYKVIFY